MSSEQAQTAHGLGKADVDADWPSFTDAELSQLLASYNPQWQVVERLWRSPRPFSVAELVKTEHEVLFIKRHHRRIRTSDGLREEHGFIAHLAAQGLPVPHIYPDKNGNSAPEYGDWTWEIHRAALNGDRYRDVRSWEPFLSPQDAAAAGNMQARLHLAASGYHAAPRREQPLIANLKIIASADPVQAINQWLSRHPEAALWLAGRDWQQAIEQQLLPWQRAVQPQLASQPALWTHNDWHGSNLLWQQTVTPAVQGIIDFGLSDLTFALFDIATAIERNFIPWLDLTEQQPVTANLPQLDAFLNAYHQQRPLSQADRQLLADLMPLVHCDFALAELHYFCAIVPDSQMASLCWDGYLLGHLRWFSTVQGQALLAFIRRWEPRHD